MFDCLIYHSRLSLVIMTWYVTISTFWCVQLLNAWPERKRSAGWASGSGRFSWGPSWTGGRRTCCRWWFWFWFWPECCSADPERCAPVHLWCVWSWSYSCIPPLNDPRCPSETNSADPGPVLTFTHM